MHGHPHAAPDGAGDSMQRAEIGLEHVGKLRRRRHCQNG
jgi:hypothetical protein